MTCVFGLVNRLAWKNPALPVTDAAQSIELQK
jgi:hypothetical protein